MRLLFLLQMSRMDLELKQEIKDPQREREREKEREREILTHQSNLDAVTIFKFQSERCN